MPVLIEQRLRLSGIRHAQFATALLPGSEACSHESPLNAALANELIHLTQHFRGLQFLRSETSHDANRDSAVECSRRAFAERGAPGVIGASEADIEEEEVKLDCEERVAKHRKRPGNVAIRNSPGNPSTAEIRPEFVNGEFDRLYTYCEKYNVPLFFSTHGQANLVEPVIKAHPGLTIVIDHLGLAQRKGQLAGQLSGGWKQRLALAACLLHKPRLLLLDEPTAGVDPKARRDFWNEIHHLAGEGLTVLVTTHYMDEAERCHRLAYISRGKLLTHGRVTEVIAHERLTTWAVTGPDLPDLTRKLRKQPGVEQTVAFGNSLHVSGSDAAALEKAIAPFRTDQYEWHQVDSGLEDVFIHLMDGADENSSP